MTWARSGVAVLVPDHLGYGERRQHEFPTAKDYEKPFRAGRQDYYFRYNSNLQLSAAGDGLITSRAGTSSRSSGHFSIQLRIASVLSALPAMAPGRWVAAE